MQSTAASRKQCQQGATTERRLQQRSGPQYRGVSKEEKRQSGERRVGAGSMHNKHEEILYIQTAVLSTDWLTSGLATPRH